MPYRSNCVVPGCANRKDRCKSGLFPSKEKEHGRQVYLRSRLCGSTATKVGCGNGSSLCKSLSFFRLPKEGKRRGQLRKKWLARIPRKNTPLTRNSYVCGVHFPEGAPDEEHNAPCMFFEKPVVRKRTTRVSFSAARRNDVFTNPTTESTTGKSAEGEQIRIEEENGLSSSTVEIDLKKQLEAQTLRIKELEKENQCVKNLLEDTRAEVDS